MGRHLFLVVEASDGVSPPDMDRVGKAIALASGFSEKCRFLWTGLDGVGNPARFLRKILSAQAKEFSGDGDRYSNSVQVTGRSFTGKTVKFCSQEGISLNLLYPYAAGEAPEGIDDLIPAAAKSKSGFSVSYPVSDGNVGSVLSAYSYFAEMGVSVSFAPIHPGRENDWGMSPPSVDDYVGAMKAVFDAWVSDPRDPGAPALAARSYVQPFVAQLEFLAGTRDPSDCAHNSCMMGWLAVKADGTIHPCGKSRDENFVLGHLDSVDSFDGLFSTDAFQEILRMSVERRNACAGCEVYPWCNGGCSMDAHDSGSMSENGGFSCVADKEIFLHTAAFFEDAFSRKADPRGFPDAFSDALLKRAIIPKPPAGNVSLPVAGSTHVL